MIMALTKALLDAIAANTKAYAGDKRYDTDETLQDAAKYLDQIITLRVKMEIERYDKERNGKADS